MGESDSAEWEPYPHILFKIVIGNFFMCPYTLDMPIVIYGEHTESGATISFQLPPVECECSNQVSALDHSCFDGGMQTCIENY